jgi:nicotinic acid mononucleotide adenylyltransferase
VLAEKEANKKKGQGPEKMTPKHPLYNALKQFPKMTKDQARDHITKLLNNDRSLEPALFIDEYEMRDEFRKATRGLVARLHAEKQVDTLMILIGEDRDL